MNVVITGSAGFLGKNLDVRLQELADVTVRRIVRTSTTDDLSAALAGADFVFHLAGVNRPADVAEFETGNSDLAVRLAEEIARTGRRIPVAFASSTQAALDNPYGRSKRRAEEALLALSSEQNRSVFVFRLPNVFGKWSRPNYNSAVATFCHNLARDLPIQVDSSSSVTLVYVDDVVETFIRAMRGAIAATLGPLEVEPTYTIAVRDLAEQIRAFRECRTSLVTERVGTGLTRALYSTYVSFLPTDRFAYSLPKYGDPRGVFVEMLKTPDSGQFSYFTAHPGVTRGGHYHHTKTEKFLVVRGRALFRFRHVLTGEHFELVAEGENPQVVETIPGWAHDITNVGSEEMVVMLWANENFDRARPDTITRALA